MGREVEEEVTNRRCGRRAAAPFAAGGQEAGRAPAWHPRPSGPAAGAPRPACRARPAAARPHGHGLRPARPAFLHVAAHLREPDTCAAFSRSLQVSRAAARLLETPKLHLRLGIFNAPRPTTGKLSPTHSCLAHFLFV